MTSPETLYESLLGRPVLKVVQAHGGDIGESFQIELKDGTLFFAKRYPGGASTMTIAEAHGLNWLRETSSLRIPLVIATTSEGDPHLVLEWIEQRPKIDTFDEVLGHGLAALA